MNSAEPPAPAIQRYWKTSSDDLSGLWFDAYGWIACYFAQIEGLSYALIERLGTTEEKSRFAKLPFQARMEKAKVLVCGHMSARGTVELSAEWAVYMEEARLTAPMRNRILHNPLTVSLALGDPLHDEEAGIVLTHEAGKPILKLGAVQLFSKTMHELNVRMQDLLARSGLAQP